MLQGWTQVHLSRNNSGRNRTLMPLWTYSGKPYWVPQQWVLFHTVKLSLVVVKHRSMVKGMMRATKACTAQLWNTLYPIVYYDYNRKIDMNSAFIDSFFRKSCTSQESSAIITASSNIWSTPQQLIPEKIFDDGWPGLVLAINSCLDSPICYGV